MVQLNSKKQTIHIFPENSNENFGDHNSSTNHSKYIIKSDEEKGGWGGGAAGPEAIQ